jgi:5-methyltetrahydrofolate--homocysteine methyltransferase
MHTPMDEIIPSLKALQTVWSGRIGVYPNNGISETRLDWKGKAKSFTAEEFAVHAKQWVDCGAQYVGGCCGFGPQHIQAACSLLCLPCDDGDASRSGSIFLA